MARRPTTTPTVRGRRVTLREHRDADATLIRSAVADPHIPSITTVPRVDDADAGLQGIHRLELVVEPWNTGSLRAAEGAGFACEGMLRGWQLVDGEPRDMLMFSLLVADVRTPTAAARSRGA